ncbi:MAG: type IX secretion system sortase PorU [Paludibacteraceae bacterium]|nr:type IX secretion system sortase PorU [Paludibacteraceae bacterium]
MKRLTIILSLLTFALASFAAHTYTSQSVLANGKWVKIRVQESGVYCLTYDELASAGLNPADVRIYGYGGAMLSQDFSLDKIDDLPPVAFYMNKGSDGVFGKGDYILFYAQGVDSWEYKDGHFVHTRNPYSSYGYYFLSDDAGEQRFIQDAEALTDAAYAADTYTAYMLHDLDSVNLVEPSGKAGGGRTFYGEQLNSARSKLQVTFPFSDIVAGSKLDICCRVAAASTNSSTFTMSVGDSRFTCITEGIGVSDFYTKATKNINDRFSLPADGTGEQVFSLSYSNSLSGSRGYLNYIEMAATCRMVMRGQEMLLTNVEHLGKAGNTRYTLDNASNDTEIWDVSVPGNVTRVPSGREPATLNIALSYVGYNSTLQTLLAVKPNTADGWRKPQVMGEVANQNLHALKNIDLVIICPEEFRSAAQVIADAHEQYDAITTAIVTDQQVFNEFSSGTPDATAYRWIMKMLYDRATSATNRPKWLLLLGDGSYDNRKLMPTSGPNTLLTYQAVNSEIETKAYASDDYFGFLDDDEGTSDTSARMDIGVGRLPVSSVASAEGVARKIATYLRNDNPGKWRQQLMFVADDGDGNLHTRIGDEAAESVRIKNKSLVVNKIYLDAYMQEASASGESYPLAKNRFLNLLNEGVLFFDYSGHGGYNNISSEALLTLRDCRMMTNANQGFWMLATCGFAHFDAYEQSASEEAVINPDGGAIAVMSACRTVYASQNRVLNRQLCDTLFSHTNDFSYNMTIGDACRMAKNNTGNIDENKMSYILLGDPAIRLHYPTDYRVRTEQASDTLNALTLHTFTGWVETSDGDTAQEFNGSVNITLMDKLQQITTRDNDEADEEKKTLHTYNDYPNTLFQGQARVTNGHFNYTFMMPKDIRYNYGNGRITYYAMDSINGEGVGHYEDFVVGGSSSVEIVDTIGPDLRIYLNSPSFVNGDKTTEQPHFFADIYDEHGINTAGSGIGHDLLLTIDADPNKMYVVNDYYASSGSYQSGQVSYRLDELEEGAHTLTFRAWDMLNNSSSKSLNFEVVKGLEPTMYSVMSYPNPVRVNEVLHFTIDYDQPDELMEMNVYVFSPQGERVYHAQRKGTEQYTFSIDDARLTPGVYMYRVSLTTTNGDLTGRAGKLIVIEK